MGGEMSSGVRSVQPEQTLLTAARIMCEKHVHRLPVLNLDGKPVGLITSMDVVAALVNAIDEREATGPVSTSPQGRGPAVCKRYVIGGMPRRGRRLALAANSRHSDSSTACCAIVPARH